MRLVVDEDCYEFQYQLGGHFVQSPQSAPMQPVPTTEHRPFPLPKDASRIEYDLASGVTDEGIRLATDPNSNAAMLYFLAENGLVGHVERNIALPLILLEVPSLRSELDRFWCDIANQLLSDSDKSKQRGWRGRFAAMVLRRIAPVIGDDNARVWQERFPLCRSWGGHGPAMDVFFREVSAAKQAEVSYSPEWGAWHAVLRIIEGPDMVVNAADAVAIFCTSNFTDRLGAYVGLLDDLVSINPDLASLYALEPRLRRQDVPPGERPSA
jgi:hypothetical protein